MPNLLSVCGIEYLIIDENLKILDMSLGVNHFADIPHELQLGQDVRIVFPELEGLEDIFEAIRQGEQDNFELKGIMRSLDTASPLYIDIRITNTIKIAHCLNPLIVEIIYTSGNSLLKNINDSLDFSQGKTAIESASSSPSSDFHKLRILLTEDNVVNQKIALKQLKSLGYSADIANNGKEALQLLAKIPYDLILMDCQMPILDGLETTKQIHLWQESSFASGRRPIVIAMTANAMRQDKQMCLDAGMDDYLSKPMMKEDLAATLQHWKNLIFIAKETNATKQTVSTTDVDLVDLQIDWERLHQISENNPEFELELLQMFVEDIQPRLAVLKIAIADHDYKQIAIQTHQIKGASANIGATTMNLAAEKLEQLAHNQECGGATNLILELEEFVQRIQEFLIRTLPS